MNAEGKNLSNRLRLVIRTDNHYSLTPVQYWNGTAQIIPDRNSNTPGGKLQKLSR